jgi:hypothetical protein
MTRQCLVVATVFGIAACVANSPEEPEPTDEVGISVAESNPFVTEGRLESVEAANVPATTIIPAAEPQVICRKVRLTGSHIPKRVCRTRAQIEAEQAEAQETLGELSKRTYSGTNRDAAGD